MPYYCVNTSAQVSTGEHEVHDLGSPYTCLPRPTKRIELGFFPSCTGALDAARKHFPHVNGCRRCAEACHTE
jgi:hypothetical protein